MLNKVLLQGRLVADPELRYTSSGIAVANFRVASDRDVKDANGERQADFINVVAWRKGGEFVAQYFRKGDMIVLEGRLQSRSYEDNGRRVYITEIVMEHAYFGGPKKQDNNHGGYQQSGYQQYNPSFGTEVAYTDEDLPF